MILHRHASVEILDPIPRQKESGRIDNRPGYAYQLTCFVKARRIGIGRTAPQATDRGEDTSAIIAAIIVFQQTIEHW